MLRVTSTLSEINADAGRFGFKESNQTQTLLRNIFFVKTKSSFMGKIDIKRIK